MKKHQRLLFIFLILPLLLRAEIFYTQNKFTLIGLGARAHALNGAYTAVVDDYSATFWNPAGLAYMHSMNFGGMYSQMGLDRSLQFFAVVLPLSGKNTIGVSYASFIINNIEARQGNSLQPDYVFNSAERMMWLTLSRKLFNNLALAVNAKYIHHKLCSTNAVGGGIDIGVLLQIVKGCRISLVSQDINSYITWDTGRYENMKRVDRLGFSIHPLSNAFIAIDVMNIDNHVRWSAGTELRVGGVFKIRSGLQEDVWSFGAGLALAVLNKKFLLINYSIKDDVLTKELYHVMDFNLQLF